MTRAGRKDRGLLQRVDATGKPMWYVRFWHEGRERRFGRFPTKTKAREFYEKAKLEQKEGRFFPERYQCGAMTSCRTFSRPMLRNGLTDETNGARKAF